MLLIHEELKAYQSDECSKCMDDFDMYAGYGGYTDMCKNCEEMKCITFKCPHCDTEHKFFGSAAPVFCDKCKILLPDVIDLKVSTAKRLKYHTAIMELFD